MTTGQSTLANLDQAGENLFERLSGAVAGRDPRLMFQQVEVDLEAPWAMWDRTGRQAPGGHVQDDVPRVVGPRRLRRPDLPDDL